MVMSNDLILSIITAIAGTLTASSLISTVYKYIQMRAKKREFHYEKQLKKYEVELEKQLLELELMQKQLERDKDTIESYEKYEKTKTLINKLINQYKDEEKNDMGEKKIQ